MDIAEVLKLADELVFTKTGKHLDYLQEAILRGTIQDKTYTEIADEVYSSSSHVRNVGSELWKILSEGWGENITKANFRVKLEKPKYNYQSAIVENITGETVTVNNKLNICPERARSHSTPTPETPTAKTRQYITDAPIISAFYGRTTELATLEKWIVQEHCNLITLLGLSGIGKTTLSLHLLTKIQHHFDTVIWRSLSPSPPLETTLKSLIKILSNQPEIDIPANIPDRLSLLMDSLRKNRSLIILDDVQTLFNSGQLAGSYRPNLENYAILFKLIGETSHPSCFILNSWEPPREIATLIGENFPVRSLQLNSLGTAAADILRTQNLLAEETWETLISTYQGNPLWLKIVATLIQELFRGRVDKFLEYDKLYLAEELVAILHPHFQRLSELEKIIIAQISRQVEPVSLPQLLKETERSPSELFNVLQSLQRRSLMETQEQDNETLFTVGPVVREWVKTQVPHE